METTNYGWVDKLVTAQGELNTKVLPNWRNDPPNYNRAIWLEAAEALESTPWKWWKAGKLDVSNVMVELTDIFHFAMSQAIVDKGSDKDATIFIKEVFKKSEDIELDMSLQDYLEAIARFALLKSTEGVFVSLSFAIRKLLGLTVEVLHEVYIGKNALNEFRKENGYYEGYYEKQWTYNGHKVEDNEVMLDLLQIWSDHHREEDLKRYILDGLDKYYDQMNIRRKGKDAQDRDTAK